MKNSLKILGIIPLIIFTLSATEAVAQKKSETKLFKKTVAAGDTTSFNKFLAKYPNSVYSPIIQAKKDSLIKTYNTTIYTQEQTDNIFRSNVARPDAVAGKDFIAFSQRKNNVESILGIIAPDNRGNYLRIVRLEENNGSWQITADRQETRYIQDDGLAKFAFVPSDNDTMELGNFQNLEGAFSPVTVKGEKYLLFNYINYTDGTDARSGWENNDVELISNLVSLSGENIFNTMFSGERVGNSIHGKCSDSAQGGIMATPQINHLVGYLAKLSYLKPADKERELTKEAIKWWYSHNPKGKQTLDFGVLQEDHPIVQKFLKSKTIERSANNSADFFDIMGTTVLCAHNKGTGQYLLVWCEPQPKNTKKDKTLNTIYFEKGNTIVLYYYEGNRTSKERINLGTRQKR